MSNVFKTKYEIKLPSNCHSLLCFPIPISCKCHHKLRLPLTNIQLVNIVQRWKSLQINWSASKSQRRLLKLPISICLSVCGHKMTGSTNKSPRSALSLRSLSVCLSPDDLSSVSLSRSKSLDIDWDPTGGSRHKINKESVAMNSSLTHPNMKGRIIPCQAWESGHVFLRQLSYKLPLLLYYFSHKERQSQPHTCLKICWIQWWFEDFS